MPLGSPGFVFNWTFFWDLLNIMASNLVLSGDNAVLIAMAVRRLPPHLRKKGFIPGAAAAVAGRIVLTLAVAAVIDLLSARKLAKLKSQPFMRGRVQDSIPWSSWGGPASVFQGGNAGLKRGLVSSPELRSG